MKKLVLLMLVGMVPFLTYSQKRTKKGKDTKTEKKDNSYDSKVNFMIIKGVEVDMSQEGMDQEEKDSKDASLDRLMKKHLKPISRLSFNFDVGSLRNEEVQKMMEDSKGFRTMAQAVNKAAEYGWEFINSTIIVDGDVTVHYYYMKR